MMWGARQAEGNVGRSLSHGCLMMMSAGVPGVMNYFINRQRPWCMEGSDEDAYHV